MTGFDAGRVRVRLTLAGERVAAVEVRCERPDIAAALRGRPADEAVALVPLVYSLCGQAQGIAARAALAAAQGATLAPHCDACVAAEAAREHAWKLLIDWPHQLGCDTDEAMFVRIAKAATYGDLAAELRDHPVFEAMFGRLAESDDILLAGAIAERRDSLIALLERRETAAGCVAAEPVATEGGACRGRATVETARGELLHEIALDGERIADYRIVAPTDRLFAADGALAQLLGDARKVGSGDTAAWVRRAIMALDPCVPWELEIVAQTGPD